MTSDFKEMYDNLNKLLQDICEFLSDDKLAKFSPKDKKLADNLIQRSKTQLLEISKIAANCEEDDRGSYVDMSGKTEQIEDEVKSEKEVNIYSYVDENEANLMNKNDMMLPAFTISPFKDLSAKDMCRDIKTGSIQRQVRIAFFQTYRRMFAGIHNKWFLLYGNEKAARPCLALDLKFHRIEELQNTDNATNTTFTIYSITEEKKKYCFSARSNKDMHQWIVVINRIVSEIGDENEPRYTMNLGVKNGKNKEISEAEEQPEYQQIEEQDKAGENQNYIEEDGPEYYQVESQAQEDVVLRNKKTARSDIEPASYQDVEEPPSKNYNTKSESRKQILLKMKGKQPLPPLPPLKFFKPDPSVEKRQDQYEDDDTEVVYEQIVSSKPKPPIVQKPKLNQNRVISIQSTNSERSSTKESIEYEQVDHGSSTDNLEDSFSEDDDEPIYDQVITLQ